MASPFALFNSSSMTEYSGAFPVMVGSSVILSAWGLPKYIELTPEERGQNQKPRNMPFMAIVQKMAFSTGLYPEAKLCDNDKFLLPQVEYEYVEDVTSCGLWNLSACQNLVVITTPGVYRLRLNDPAAIGNVYIAGTSVPNTELLPASNLLHLS